MFGSFLGGPQDWSAVDTISLNVALNGSNPGVFFEVTLLDERSEPIGTYEGSATSVGDTYKLIELRLMQVGLGDPTRLSGLEIIWNGPGAAGSGLALKSIIGSTGPLNPLITSVSYGISGFTLTWSGTGTLPVIVQRRESLETGQWTAIAQGVATGEYTDTDPPPGKAFYQVVVP